MAVCPVCGESFRGRSDKKFCSGYCRTHYHNKKNAPRVNLIRRINNRLRRNRMILNSFLQRDRVTVSMPELAELGFDFRYFTHDVTAHEKVHRYCYDVGYVALGTGTYRILKSTVVTAPAEYNEEHNR